MKQILFILIFAMLLVTPTFAQDPIIAYHTTIADYVQYAGTATLDDFQSITLNVTAYESTTLTNTYAFSMYDNYIAAQKFYYAIDETVSGVSFTMGEMLAEGMYRNKVNITVKLCNASATAVPDLTSCHAEAKLNYTDINHISNYPQSPYTAVSVNGVYQAVLFNQSVRIKGNATTTTQVGKYFIVIIPDRFAGLSTSSYYILPYSNSAGFTNGNLFYSANGGTTWTNSTTVDIHFELLSPTSNQYAMDMYSVTKSGSTYTLPLQRQISVVGGELRIDGGTKVLFNQTASASNYFYVGGGANMGGFLNITGTADNIVVFDQFGSLSNTLQTAVFNNGGKLKMDWTSIQGSFSNYGAVYTSANTDIRNCNFTNSRSAGYVGFYTSGSYWPSRINVVNTTIYVNDTTGSVNIFPMYNAYAPANLINVTLKTNIGNTNGYAIYQTGQYYAGYQGTFGVNYNGTNITSSHIRMFSNSSTNTIGGSIFVHVVDTNGAAISDASVKLVPQYFERDASGIGFYPTDNYDSHEYSTQSLGLYDQRLDYKQEYMTDSNGDISDNYGKTYMYMKSKRYADIGNILIEYISGSTKSLRPLQYEWKNDGTDYSYYLDVSKAGYLLNRTFLDADYSYNLTITLTTGSGGAAEDDGSASAIAISLGVLVVLLGYLSLKTNIKELQMLFISLDLLLLDISFYVISEIASEAGLTGLQELFLGLFNGFMIVFVTITFILVILYLYDLLVKLNKIKPRG